MVLDPETGNTFGIIGSSKSGKTTFLMWLFKKYFSGGDYISTLFCDNSQIKLYKGTGKKLLKAIEFDKAHQTYVEAQKVINVQTKNKYRWCNMFDDILALRYAKVLNKSILTYRNSNISSVVCIQYAKLMSKESRGNYNNIVLFSVNNGDDIKVLVEMFLQPIFQHLWGLHKSQWEAHYRMLTADHNFVYIHPQTGYCYSSLKGMLQAGYDGGASAPKLL